MKLQRLLGALCAGLMLFSLSAKAAEQSSIVTPVVGPMPFSTFVGTYLNPALRAIQSCNWGTSAPANGPGAAPIAYESWCDTTSNPVLVKRYDGASWVITGSLNTSTHAWLPYLTGGVSGGVPYFSATNIMGTSALLAQYGFVVGGGTGAAPATITACTDNQIAFGVTSSNPLCRSVTGDVTFATGASAIGANKVLNSMFATMAANTTKCNATGGSAVPTDCTASTMRTNLALVPGTDVQAFDADLAALAANSTAGLWAYTGAGTGAARTLTAPAAGLTISNPAGTAGNPTFALANDLAALEGLSSTGIARRTGTDAWSVGTAVALSEMATQSAYSFIVNNTGSTAAPTAVDIGSFAAKTSPASTDLLVVSDQAASGALKKSTIAQVVGALASGVSSIAGNTGAFTLNKGITNSTNAIGRALNESTLQASPSNPTGTTNGTGLMMGLGSVCTITPTYSGRVFLHFYGNATSSSTGNAAIVKAWYGTSTAPANAAAITGTQIGPAPLIYAAVAANQGMFVNGGIITGLTPGTAYWFDLSVASTGGTASVANLGCSAFEF